MLLHNTKEYDKSCRQLGVLSLPGGRHYTIKKQINIL